MYKLAALGVALLALTAGCSASSDEAEEDDGTVEDDTQTPGESADAIRFPWQAWGNECKIGSESGRLYKLKGGVYHVCWVQVGGPFGAADNSYLVRNTTTGAKRAKIALDNTTDTNCKLIRGRSTMYWSAASTKLAGKPQDMKYCR